jgi:hypothetical protein
MGRDFDPAAFDPSGFEDNLRQAKLAVLLDRCLLRQSAGRGVLNR